MNYSIRPITGNDVDQIIAVWNQSLPLDAITRDTLDTKIMLDENFDWRTFQVAVVDERVAGFVVGMHGHRVSLGDHDPEGNRSWVTAFAVKNEYRRRGIGKDLFSMLLDTFRSLGKTECYVSSYPPGYFTPGVDVNEYSQSIGFLKSIGFSEEGQLLSMDAPIALFKIKADIIEKEERLKSDGIVIRAYRRDDLLSFLRFMGDEMPDDWHRIARKNLRDLSRGLFFSDQIFIAIKKDKVIGYCQYEGSHFGPFGVARKFQGKGIGTVLLARSLERMRIRGFHNAWVMWTDDAAARVYSKFGFTETRRFVVLKISLKKNNGMVL